MEILQNLRVKSKVDNEKTISGSQESLISYEDTHDWTFVHGALKVLQSSNLFSEKLNSFDGYLRNKFLSLKNYIFNETNEKISNEFKFTQAELLFFKMRAKKQEQQLLSFLEHLTDGK